MSEMLDAFDQLWIEKYRPKTIDNVVLNEEQKVFFQKCIIKEEIPHVLFFGPPGSGKTTLARILIDALVKDPMDILSINGSDNTGVEFVRETIIPFLKSPPMSSKLKYVFIDEFDYLSPNAQASLRNVMETYADNGRFICTCNYQHKIIDPLLSRLTSFEMKMMPKDFVVNFVESILTNEKVKYEKKTVESIVEGLIPDVRKIVNLIQRHVVDNKLTSVKSEEMISSENKIIGLIKELCDGLGGLQQQTICNKVAPTIQSLLFSKDKPDINKLYTFLFNDENLPSWAKIKVNYYANNNDRSFSKEYNFMACVYDIYYAGIQYTKMFGIKK